MESASSSLSEEQFLCSICLDVFTEPVSTPCGHNYCKACITQLWDTADVCKCPLCNKTFYTRPEIFVNTLISGWTDHFRNLKLKREEERKVQQMIHGRQEKIEEANPTKVNVRNSLQMATLKAAVSQTEQTLSQEMTKIMCDAQLRRIQQYEVDVTLDPDTAQPNLILSWDRKKVNDGDDRDGDEDGMLMKNLSDNTKRFSECVCVLGKESFSSGRFYYEVQVTGKTEWDLGVVRDSIDRKGQILSNPKNGYWTIRLRNGNEYKALAGPEVLLPVRELVQKVGVFVDYEEGLVSFYDVENRVHLYSFTGCSFTERLFPFFSPCLNNHGINAAPLIISPVNHVDYQLSGLEGRVSALRLRGQGSIPRGETNPEPPKTRLEGRVSALRLGGHGSIPSQESKPEPPEPSAPPLHTQHQGLDWGYVRYPQSNQVHPWYNPPEPNASLLGTQHQGLDWGYIRYPQSNLVHPWYNPPEPNASLLGTQHQGLDWGYRYSIQQVHPWYVPGRYVPGSYYYYY